MSVRGDLLQWTAAVGAVTAQALSLRDGCTSASARARLAAAERAGLLAGSRPLTDEPALYCLTREGLRAVGIDERRQSRLSAAGAHHAAACARVAARLERAYPELELTGEVELRRRERGCSGPLASALLAGGAHRSQAVHRPDLVLWPRAPHAGLPVVVEVELAIKSPGRLTGICSAWARARCVAGVLYVVSPQAEAPVARAIKAARGHMRIALVAEDLLSGTPALARAALQRAVAGAA